MLERLNDIKKGYNSICIMGEKHPDMLMDLGVLKLSKGETYEFNLVNKEMAILLIQGEIIYNWGDKNIKADRLNCFDEVPWCLHICAGTNVKLTAKCDSELFIQSTANNRSFDAVMYHPHDIQTAKAGADNEMKGCARRNIRTVFDYDNAPYSNMVLGEVVNFPGRWSSYPPHHHPQPEVYYYKFDKPQGFGISLIGETPYKISQNSYSIIPGGLVHPQNSAPGYAMYYVWAIRHLDNDPWKKTRIDEECHKWLMEADADIWDEI